MTFKSLKTFSLKNLKNIYSWMLIKNHISNFYFISLFITFCFYCVNVSICIISHSMHFIRNFCVKQNLYIMYMDREGKVFCLTILLLVISSYYLMFRKQSALFSQVNPMPCNDIVFLSSKLKRNHFS